MKVLTKQSQSNVKLNNLHLALDTIINHEPLSRADIVRLTHISKPTISSLIDELIARNIIYEIGEGVSKAGRKPILLKFNSRRKYFLAFEMGRAGYRVAISDLKGAMINKTEDEFENNAVFSQRLNLLKNMIYAGIKDAGIDPYSILRIICIAPGVYVEKGKELKWISGNTSNGSDDIKYFFAEVFHTEVVINHSTKLSLLGEKIAGKAKGLKNVVYIDFAYGLGCSLMVNGDIYFGPNNSAGEFGYFYSSPEEFDSYRIKPYEFGALENKISGKALREKGIKAAREDKDSKILALVKGNPGKITAKTLFMAAKLDDPAANSILKESFKYFNMALCNIINLFTPEAVIFGGGFSFAGDFLLDLIRVEIREKVLILPRLEISELKNSASIIGGIHYLIEDTDFLTEL